MEGGEGKPAEGREPEVGVTYKLVLGKSIDGERGHGHEASNGGTAVLGCK